MVKFFFVVLLATSGGCGWFDRETAKLIGKSESCIDGVTYIQFASGVTVKYRPDGAVWTCQ